jgi:hypothetical protein
VKTGGQWQRGGDDGGSAATVTVVMTALELKGLANDLEAEQCGGGGGTGSGGDGLGDDDRSGGDDRQWP